MTQEEKAQRYDEAIKRLEDIKTGKCQKTFVFTEGLFEHIFPELAESEDEKIRKELLKAVKESEESLYIVMTPRKRESLIAWLEKQGEQKPVEPQQDMLSQEQYAKAIDECIYGEKWSEEDENTVASIISSLSNPLLYPPTIHDIEWLKSLLLRSIGNRVKSRLCTLARQ